MARASHTFHCSWAILTGEYPAQPGGVSDYTHLVAKGLAAAGDSVRVWAPATAMPDPADERIAVNRLPDYYGWRSLEKLSRDFARLPADTRVLVQYVPHVWGWRGLNVPFCFWLWRQRHRHHVTVMFHEVAYPWITQGRVLRHNFLAAVNRLMALLVVRSARRICVSIPAWADTLRPFSGGRPVEWLPVPSTVPGNADQARVVACRNQILGRSDGALVGHFSTFGGQIAEALHQVIPSLLAQDSCVTILLVGGGGEAFVETLVTQHPHLAGRLRSTGRIEPVAVCEHLSACDLLIQPYPDGISSRRTSAMAGLACGLPILTTRGFLTEPIWEQSGAVYLVDSAAAMVPAAGMLLRDQAARTRLRAASRELYFKQFSLDRTVTRLRSTFSSGANRAYSR